jgi:hypothetical protein
VVVEAHERVVGKNSANRLRRSATPRRDAGVYDVETIVELVVVDSALAGFVTRS